MNVGLIVGIVLLIALIAVVVIQQNKYKNLQEQSQKSQADLSAKEQILKKEAFI